MPGPGARIVGDAEVGLEDYAVVSWNVVLMDTYRVPLAPAARRVVVGRVPTLTPRRLEGITVRYEPGSGIPRRLEAKEWAFTT